MKPTKKVALITGSSVGVGRATAIRFAEDGCNVIINFNKSAQSAAETVELCQEKGASAISVQADISKDSECRKLIQEGVDRMGRLDYLVNNAATTRFVEFSDLEGLDEETWMHLFRTNVMGSFFCTRAAVPHLRMNAPAAIVNVASVAGISGIGSSIAYAASKAALINMTKALARTFGPEIRVNAVAPGAINTRWLREGVGEQGLDKMLTSLRKTTPLRDIAQPEDVADAVVWLSLQARMITGDTIVLDGGFLLGGPAGMPKKQKDN